MKTALFLSLLFISSLSFGAESARLEFNNGNDSDNHPVVGYEISRTGNKITGKVLGFEGSTIELEKISGRWQGHIGDTKINQLSDVAGVVTTIGVGATVKLGNEKTSRDYFVTGSNLLNPAANISADVLQVTEGGKKLEMYGLKLERKKKGLYEGLYDSEYPAKLEISGYFEPLKLVTKEPALFLILNVVMFGADHADDQVGIVH